MTYKKSYQVLISEKDRTQVPAYTAPFPLHVTVPGNLVKWVKNNILEKLILVLKLGNINLIFQILRNFSPIVFLIVIPNCNTMLKVDIRRSFLKAVKWHKRGRNYEKSYNSTMRENSQKYGLTMTDGEHAPENISPHHWQTTVVRLAGDTSILPTWCHASEQQCVN